MRSKRARSARWPCTSGCSRTPPATPTSKPSSTTSRRRWSGRRRPAGCEDRVWQRGSARLGYEHDRDAEYVRAMRRHSAERMLMIDKPSRSGGRDRRGPPDARDGGVRPSPLAECAARQTGAMRELRAKMADVAYGGMEDAAASASRFCDRYHDAVGVDPGRARNHRSKKICDCVEAYRRQANAHAPSAIVTAASSICSTRQPASCSSSSPLRNPMQHDLVTASCSSIADGWVYPPNGPGLEVIEEVVEHYRSERPAR